MLEGHLCSCIYVRLNECPVGSLIFVFHLFSIHPIDKFERVDSNQDLGNVSVNLVYSESSPRILNEGGGVQDLQITVVLHMLMVVIALREVAEKMIEAKLGVARPFHHVQL